MIRVPMALTAIVVTSAAAHLCLDYAFPQVQTQPVAVAESEAEDDFEYEVDSASKEAEVQQRIQHRKEFAAYTDGVVEQLAGGRLGLRQARDRILYYCLTHYPDYLHHIQIIEKGNTLKNKLASCLMRFVKDYQTFSEKAPVADETLSSLESEFNELLAEDEHETPPNAS
jgi:hypothetical protein